LCGFDLKTVDLTDLYYQFRMVGWAAGRKPSDVKKADPPAKLRADGTPYPREHWVRLIESAEAWRREARVPYGRDAWDVDHITPVSDGGDFFAWENLRVLCCPCHKKVTAEFATLRAERRREANRHQPDTWS
jgi:hypothetical protein